MERHPDERVRFSRHDRASGGGVGGVSDAGHLSILSELDSDSGDGGSPGSAKGDLFFASDLVHPTDGSNDYGAVDPRVVGGPAAEGTLLSRLHDGDAHAGHHDDMSMGRHSFNANEVSSDRFGSEQEGAALMRSLPRPPSPPTLGPDRRPPPGQPQQGLSFGHGSRDGGLALSSQRGSPGSGAAARRKGQSAGCMGWCRITLEVVVVLAPWW